MGEKLKTHFKLVFHSKWEQSIFNVNQTKNWITQQELANIDRYPNIDIQELHQDCGSMPLI
jgi:hypothetical protein